MNWLLILTVVLGVLALARLMKVMEISAILRGEDVNELKENDSKVNALVWVVFGIGFFGFFLWQVDKYAELLLPIAASEHGVQTDKLFAVSLSIITVVFFLTHLFLFYFIYRYYSKKGQVSSFFSHSTKLELIWTVVPTVVLTSLIVYGIQTWNNITTPAPEDTPIIELYAKQFDWTARYAGKDNKLGNSSFRLIEGANDLGIDVNDPNAADDKIVRGEFHIPVGKPVNFLFHSRDIIHSAYMPHFRAQMNCVPGMTTRFHFVPTITTAEMRAKTNNENFDYLVLCNKICGASHYNMQIKIVVDTPEEYERWLADKKTFAESNAPKEEAAPAPDSLAVGTDTLKVKPDSTSVAVTTGH
ncbi:MAG: cytochrome c oxidase subunit II [Bacteroidia bacterium]|nr:cytochrome c oxidase subunit II [Bacteroidia bacterium]